MKVRCHALRASLVGIWLFLMLGCGRDDGPTPAPAENQPHAASGTVKEGLPRLVDLGRGFCIPCKMMAPILEELKEEYDGRLDVECIDVGKNREAVRKYGIRLIPTQIFLDGSGKEVFRHEGFMSKDDILEAWERHGVDLTQKVER